MSIDLHELIKNDLFILPKNSAGGTENWEHCIKEEKKNGEMNLTVIMSKEFPRIDLPPKSIFFLKNQNCADAAIWEHIDGKRYRLHLFEMKRAMKPTEWQHVKMQFNGAYLRCRIIAGLLNLEIDNCIVLYSVFHNDKFQNPPIEYTEPVLERVPVDVNTAIEKTEWESDKCNIFINGCPAHFGKLTLQHKKIHLKELNSENIPSGEFYLLEMSNQNRNNSLGISQN
ncbi:MAG: hypothetical protein LBP59_01035 [Planctomycetaceae bacterium]|jgi:hypothetical protein|nr:hypothetical protein [Planctomycetaceae bacterium]